MGDLSPHFSRAEFKCHGFGRPGHPNHGTIIDQGLVELLELIRAHAGRPVKIVSGHRCAWWNARIGGAGASEHLAGRAADLEEGVVRPEVADKLGAMGIGVKSGWATHVDRRARKARWSYD